MIIESKPVTIAKAKKMLEGLNRELNQFQRRTLDYAILFSKIDPDDAERLAEQLTAQLGVSLSEAVQIVNSMPETLEELRVFIPRHKVIETAKLKDALALIDKYRK
ncbi:MAG: hypothetical protein QXJ75_01950 [Candidatus Bathyarchaeia archaeon]